MASIFFFYASLLATSFNFFYKFFLMASFYFYYAFCLKTFLIFFFAEFFEPFLSITGILLSSSWSSAPGRETFTLPIDVLETPCVTSFLGLYS